MSMEYRAFLQQFDFGLPAGYADYLFAAQTLEFTNGSYLVEAGEVLPYNADYAAAEFYPGFLLIGSNGSGEVYAIEKATGYFVETPFIGHDEETPVLLGRTWPEFLRYLQGAS